ncbi:MAG: nucleotidyltransferase family protein [Ignavibacteriae bacterium]|nr:nucleotidyltransferase family protein [Ignavibacteriota bacterium]MCB9214604.1 nucleotidyltransferase family protein [Ignavibacteria bacterium]
MNVPELQSALTPYSAELRERFDVRELLLFRSVARNKQTISSDVDLIVKFNGRASFDRYMDLKFFLEKLLGRDVDLVTEKGIKEAIRSQILEDAIRVT